MIEPFGAPQVHPPDPSVRVPPQPTHSAVASEIYRQSGMTYAGRGPDSKSWAGLLAEAAAPSNMLALQQEALAKKLRRPLREREILKMRENAKASAVASAAVLVGTAACLCGAALAGVFVWRCAHFPTSRRLSCTAVCPGRPDFGLPANLRRPCRRSPPVLAGSTASRRRRKSSPRRPPGSRASSRSGSAACGRRSVLSQARSRSQLARQ